MATIFRKRITRYVDADGRQCTKSTPGARKQRTQSQCWYGRYVDATGRPREIKLVAGGRAITDEKSARVFCNQLETDAHKETTGVVDRYKRKDEIPLSEHIQAYRGHLQAKDNTRRHVKETVTKLTAVFARCGFRRLSELAADPVAQWLSEARQSERQDRRQWQAAGVAKTCRQIAESFDVCVQTVTAWRKQGAPIEPRKKNDLAAIARWLRERDAAGGPGMSIATSNHYVRAVKSFGAWLVRGRHWPDNPFVHLSGLNAETDVRRERRALANEEFARLVAVAQASNVTLHGLTGPDRAMVYLTSAYTGLRSGELASLDESSLDLDSDAPTITVAAAYSKRRRRDVLPLRPDLAGRLRVWLADRHAQTRDDAPTLRLHAPGSKTGVKAADATGVKLWPGRWHESAAEILRHDLDAAGIPYEDQDGRVFDFHSLRHQFISSLAAAGVHPKVAQTLARHSTITLTMDRYTHLAVADVAGALDNLPSLPTQATTEVQAATGTDGGILSCTKMRPMVSPACISCPLLAATANRRRRPKKRANP